MEIRKDLFPAIEGVRIIGIGYKARNGKDAACAAIRRAFPLAERYAFADDLKAYCRIAHGMTEKDAPLLQRVGMEQRSIDENVWLKSVYWKIADQMPPLAIITDMRFPNEMGMVRAMGGLTICVERFVNGVRVIDPTRDPNHPSECSLDPYRDAFDHVVRNDQSLAFFQDTIVDIAKKYVQK